MSLPHRIAATFCELGKLDDPTAKRLPGHKFNKASKVDSGDGLANPGDLTPTREGYGGGANSYYTAYPKYLITKVQGTNQGVSSAENFPAIQITLTPFKNEWSANVIDGRSEMSFYVVRQDEDISDLAALARETSGKGELVVQDWTVYFNEEPPPYCDNTAAELISTIALKPLDSLDPSDVYFNDLKFFPTEQFQPWRHGIEKGFITQGNMLCSFSAYNIRLDELGVNATNGLNQFDPSFQYMRHLWKPLNTDTAIFYSNTCTWKLKIKAELCCWNEGYKISGKIKISYIDCFEPPRFPSFPNYPYKNTTPDANDPNNVYYWFVFHGNIFKVDTSEPVPFQDIPWEVTIDDQTATGEEIELEEIPIPQEFGGNLKRLYFINGFTVDTIEPPPPPA